MQKKKKILIRIGSLRHGGAEKVLITFLKNLPKDRYEIDLLLNLYSGKYLDEAPSWINIFYLNKGEMITTNRPQDILPKAWRVGYQWMMKKFPSLLYKHILKDKKYDIEFAAIHGFRDEILNSPIQSSKKVIWIHNDLKKTEFHEYTDEEIKKFFGFDKIMVISDQIKSYFDDLAENDVQKNKIARIYNPLDTNEILSKSEKTIDNVFPDDGVPTFVSVGTVFPQKGFDRLIKMHHRLLNEGLQNRLIIVGDGYDFDNIKKLIETLGVQDSVKMVGFTDNPYPYFKQADFYILSSRYEGFPTVLFEAITLEKKIIATRVSGVEEMLQNGQLGHIVDNNEEGIYEGMKKAIKDPTSFNHYQEEINKTNMPFALQTSVEDISNILDNL